MDKPSSILKLKALLKEVENDRYEFKRKNIEIPIENLRGKLYKENQHFFESYDKKMQDIKAEIYAKEQEIKNKKKDFLDERMVNYVKYKFSRGINFGYKGLSLRHIDPDLKYLIITCNGSTAGTGTAMGTGSYYYATSSHFVAFPQFGEYHNCKVPSPYEHKPYVTTNSLFEIEGGRLTNEIKDRLIKQAEEYCKLHNIQPFNIEELCSKKK